MALAYLRRFGVAYLTHFSQPRLLLLKGKTAALGWDYPFLTASFRSTRATFEWRAGPARERHSHWIFH